MARNATARKQNIETAPPPMPGSTPGNVTPQQLNRATAVQVVAGTSKPVPRNGKPARTYTVTGGPEMVMYGSCKTRLPRGKILSEASCDIEKLRKQGVQLSENPMPPWEPEADPEPEELDPETNTNPGVGSEPEED